MSTKKTNNKHSLNTVNVPAFKPLNIDLGAIYNGAGLEEDAAALEQVKSMRAKANDLRAEAKRMDVASAYEAATKAQHKVREQIIFQIKEAIGQKEYDSLQSRMTKEIEMKLEERKYRKAFDMLFEEVLRQLPDLAAANDQAIQLEADAANLKIAKEAKWAEATKMNVEANELAAQFGWYQTKPYEK